MNDFAEQPVLEFYCYPPVGGDDWRYTFATGQVRALQTAMLDRPTFLDMANAQDFSQAVDLLSGSEYSLPRTGGGLADFEGLLRQSRSAVRKLFADLIVDEPIVDLFKSRDDFANTRLALRRSLTERRVGLDYSDQGSVPAEQFEEIFEQENYALLPDYLQEAVEQAVLHYYPNRDIRQIDYAIDRVQASFNLRMAEQLSSVFLRELLRMQTDLTNTRTMFRLRQTQSLQRNVFLPGGYIELARLLHGLDVGHEAIAGLFFATPYYEIVETSVAYLTSEGSFLRLEERCENHLLGFLRLTGQLTAGPQPVIAYLLAKEAEIRKVRMVLTAKRNRLDTKLILDRLG